MGRPVDYRRANAIAEQLAAYYTDTDLIVTARPYGRQGYYISVSRGDAGILFHADQLDNGAAGFKDEALRRIRAFADNVPFVPTPIDPKLVYDDVMTLSSPEVLRHGEIAGDA